MYASSVSALVMVVSSPLTLHLTRLVRAKSYCEIRSAFESHDHFFCVFVGGQFSLS